jgi:hypothetical protein
MSNGKGGNIAPAAASRPAALVQPTELYQLCLMAGLGGQHHPATFFEPSLLAQREVLLNVALEHNMVGVIVAAARDWADGRYSKAGCSLRFLLDWAWRRVATVKERLDFNTLPLFDHRWVLLCSFVDPTRNRGGGGYFGR